MYIRLFKAVIYRTLCICGVNGFISLECQIICLTLVAGVFALSVAEYNIFYSVFNGIAVNIAALILHFYTRPLCSKRTSPAVNVNLVPFCL